MHGLFDLQTPEDLLHKLEREYARWKADPLNVDLGWNFFVTAEHLPDGLARTGPRLPKGVSYKKFKQENSLLRICSHLASSGKHFRPRDEHKSVASTHERPRAFFEPGAFIDEGFFESPALMVDRTRDEKQALSSPAASIEALRLGADMLVFWRARLL